MMANYLMDASSILYAWDNYPKKQFPSVWEWLAEQIGLESIQSIKIMLGEVEHKNKDCFQWWLKKAKLQLVEVSMEERLRKGNSIKEQIGFQGDIIGNGKGIDENDLELIAVASLCSLTVVTEEKVQEVPKKPNNYRIPLVCKRVDVKAIRFIDLITDSGKIF